ncbi:hypothetical protein IFM89_022457, partial [Coptis chinensis]
QISTMPVGISREVVVDVEDGFDSPRCASLERRRSCSYPFNPFSDGGGGGGGLSRLSFSYHKLPPQIIKLNILKLDGSSFDVQIAGNVTVGELKEAVEDVFMQSPKDGEGDISWSHVWGHFCLCYEGQKLTNDKDCVKIFGIKDGDQLHFIRHLSINYNLVKRRSRRENATCKEQPLPLSGSDISEKEENDDGYVGGDQHDEESKYFDYNAGGDQDFIGNPEFKLAHFLKGWLSYSTLWFVGRTKSEGELRPSRFSGQFLKLGSKITLTRL